MESMQELMKLEKSDLVNKVRGYYGKYCIIRSKYQNMKADFIIFKKQLQRLADSITYNSRSKASGNMKINISDVKKE